MAENRFYLISAAVAEWHDLDWLEKHRPKNGALRIENHTTRYGSIIIAGPKARDVLSQVTDADLSNAAFPWLSAREIEIGYARLLALRVNYVGELGWELHAPVEHMASIYDQLWQAGEKYGIRDFGMYAMDSMRLEKCYRGWKGDLTHEYTPFMASLDRFVDLTKSEFMGKAALLKEHNSGPRERFVPLLLEDAGTADALYCSSVFAGEGNRRPRRLRRLWPQHRQEHRAGLCPHRPGEAGHGSRCRNLRRAPPCCRGAGAALRSDECKAADVAEHQRHMYPSLDLNHQNFKSPPLRGRSDHRAKRDDPGGGSARCKRPQPNSLQLSRIALGIEIPPFWLISLTLDEPSSPSRGEECTC